jgi:hypothetical protein
MLSTFVAGVEGGSLPQAAKANMAKSVIVKQCLCCCFIAVYLQGVGMIAIYKDNKKTLNNAFCLEDVALV